MFSSVLCWICWFTIVIITVSVELNISYWTSGWTGWINPLPPKYTIFHIIPSPYYWGLVIRGSAQVTAMALSPCQRFLVVGDNHERVRISCYPEAGCWWMLWMLVAWSFDVCVCSRLSVIKSLKMKSQLLYNIILYQIYIHRLDMQFIYSFNDLLFHKWEKHNQQHQQQDIFCGLPMIDDDYWWQLSITCRKPYIYNLVTIRKFVRPICISFTSGLRLTRTSVHTYTRAAF